MLIAASMCRWLLIDFGAGGCGGIGAVTASNQDGAVVEQCCRVFLQAGAERVMPSTIDPIVLVDVDEVPQFDNLVAEADDIAFGSSHPQGGNPMSDDRSVGVVDSGFRVHDFDNLFVADASVFPCPIQANPQLTVMAMADCAASAIAAL